MKHERPTEETRERAPLYVLGVLAADEEQAFVAHLNEGCVSCGQEVRAMEAVANQLSYVVSPVSPPEGLRHRLLAEVQAQPRTTSPANPQVWKRWNQTPGVPAIYTLTANEGHWEKTGIPGIVVRRLFVDPEHQHVTMLVKAAAGTSYPRHRHADVEECYVLEGDLHVSGGVLRAGDYQRAGAGSIHEVQWTEEGCTLLIRSSMQDELLT